jgi:hypothetical protein
MMHDNSSVLETILVDKLQGEWEQILGEIQFAFVCFLLGKVSFIFSCQKILTKNIYDFSCSFYIEL